MPLTTDEKIAMHLDGIKDLIGDRTMILSSDSHMLLMVKRRARPDKIDMMVAAAVEYIKANDYEGR